MAILLTRLVRRLIASFLWRRREREIAQEMTFHLDWLRSEGVGAGMSHDEATRAAKRRFGSPLRFAEQARDIRSVRWLSDAIQDLTHVGRHLRRTPGLTVAITVTLVAGISLNTLVFSLFNAILFTSQVDRDPKTFVHLYMDVTGDWQREVAGSRNAATVEEFDTIRSNVTTLAAVTASRPGTFTLQDAAVPSLRGSFVSCNFLAAHGRPMLLGRGFLADECTWPGGPPVAVLSERGWTLGFRRDPAILGRIVRVNGQPMSIVGVAHDEPFGTPVLSLIYVPYTAEPLLLAPDYFRRPSGQVAWLDLSGRLTVGATIARAQAETNALVESLDAVHPGRSTKVLITNGALINQPGAARRAPVVIGLALAAAFLVLMLACGNVTTLLLARAMAREREIAIRISLGAGRSRIVRQLLTETFALVALAASLSVGLTYALSRPAAQMLTDFPVGAAFRPDLAVLGYTLLLSFAATVVAGLSPARSTSGDRPLHRATLLHGQAALISTQVSIATMLLVAAGFVVRTQRQMLVPPVAYDPARIIVTTTHWSRGMTAANGESQLTDLTDRLTSLPGADAVALVTHAPFGGANTTAVTTHNTALAVSSRGVSPAYFGMMGLRLLHGQLLKGRQISADDLVTPIVVSNRLARRLYPSSDALDHTIRLDGQFDARIVGVVADTSSVRLGEPDDLTLYRPIRAHDLETVTLLTRVDADAPKSTAQDITALARSLSSDSKTMSEPLSSLIKRQSGQYVAAVALTAASSGLALLLSFTGLFGLVMLSAVQRTREIGIRVALGARRYHVFSLFMSMLWRPLLKGLATGVPLAFVVATILQQARLLGGETPTYLWPYGAAILFLAMTATVSVVIPSLAAARSEPLAALKTD